MDALLLNAFAHPLDGDVDFTEGNLDEVSDRVLLACGHDVVVRGVLLKHEPHGFDVVPCVSPVALGVEVTQEELVLKPEANVGYCAGDLAGDESLPPIRGFVIEKDAVGRMNAVGFPVVDHDPVGVEFGYCIRTTGVEGRGLPLGNLLNHAVKLGGRRLVEARLI
ncbi:hypothetical protein D3C72_891400 [compost metagenome]